MGRINWARKNLGDLMTNSQENNTQTQRVTYPFEKLDRGDVVWTTVGYQEEISKNERTIVGKRPCVILSEKKFHKLFGVVIAIPITHSNQFPKANVEITSVPDIDGFAKTHQLKSVDIKRRGYSYAGKINNAELGKILSITQAFFK